jgi:cyclopropane fatty-acyl-phospholipid synthase-like methyltransferase
MKGIYNNGTYLENNPLWHEEDSQWKALQIQRIIDNNLLEPCSVCEIGCGAGQILNIMSEYRENDVKYYGYEISQNAYEICRKKTKDNLTFRLCNLLEEQKEYFDILMAIDVFEHIEDYFSFLRNLKEKAEYKIFHIPLELSVQTILRSSPIIEGRKKVGHIHYFTKDIAIEILKDTGYEIIDYYYTGSSFRVQNSSWKKRILEITRKAAFLLNKDMAVRVLGGYSLLVLAK